MSLNKSNKGQIIQQFAGHAKDTGSPSVQIALLTTRINYLLSHLKTHKKDESSRIGLLKLVKQRRRLIEYLKSSNPKIFDSVKKSLGI